MREEEWMAEGLVLKPSEFQAEIDAYESKNIEIGAVKFTIQESNVTLDSFDKMKECVNTFNRLIEKMNLLGQCDVKNMQNIKSAWMNLDEEIGQKTFGEAVFGIGKKGGRE